MLQIVLGQDQPINLNCIHHQPPNVYTAVNNNNNNNNPEQQQPTDHKGVSVEYRAKLFSDPVKKLKVALATKEDPHNDQQQQPPSAAAKKKAAVAAKENTTTATTTSAASSLKSEFFIQWNLTRCLPFLRRPVTVLAELLEVDESELPSENSAAEKLKQEKKEVSKAVSASKKKFRKFLAAASNEAAPEDDDDDEEEEEHDEDEEDDDDEKNANKNKNKSNNTPDDASKKKKTITLVVPGMMTNTNTKDTIWIGRFDLEERLKSLGPSATSSSTPTKKRRFFTISLIRMIIGSHLLISADKKSFTIVVPLPTTFLIPSAFKSRKRNKMLETELASVETVALTSNLSSPSSSSPQLFLNVKNSILIKAATEKRTQVEVVAAVNVYKRVDHMMREKRKQKQQLNNNKTAPGNFSSFSCSLDDAKTTQVAEIMNAASTGSGVGVDLVIELTLGKADEVYSSSASGNLASKAFAAAGAASRNKVLIWLVFAAVAFALIGIVTDALMKAFADETNNNHKKDFTDNKNNNDDGNDDDAGVEFVASEVKK